MMSTVCFACADKIAAFTMMVQKHFDAVKTKVLSSFNVFAAIGNLSWNVMINQEIWGQLFWRWKSEIASTVSLFLVECMRLYKPLCRLVPPSVGWLVGWSVAVHKARDLWRLALFLQIFLETQLNPAITDPKVAK